MNKLTVGSFAAMALVSLGGLSNAFADDIRLGNPAYGGNGCPSGSASVSLSPDSKALTILFDRYVAEAGGTSGRMQDRKSCNVAIPVHVPQGFSVSVFQVDYRGFNNLPDGATSDYNIEYFFAGSQGPKYNQSFAGPLNEDYTLSHTLAAQAVIWSPCGRDVILRSNSSIRTRSNGFGEETMATVDSADIKAGLLYHLEWRQCR